MDTSSTNTPEIKTNIGNLPETKRSIRLRSAVDRSLFDELSEMGLHKIKLCLRFNIYITITVLVIC